MMKVKFKDQPKTNALYLQQQLANSQKLVSKQSHRDLILQTIQYTQHKVFNSLRSDNKGYMEALWKHVSSSNPQLSELVDSPAHQRVKSVVNALKKNKLSISEKESHSCNNDELFLQEFKTKRIQRKEGSKQSLNSLHSAEKKKRIEEFIKGQRKQQLQRRNKWDKIQEKRQKQFENQDRQAKEQEEEKKKVKREEIIKKQKQRHFFRDEQKIIREQRNSQYLRVKQKLNEQIPLYMRFQKKYQEEAQAIEKQKLQKMTLERQHLLEHLTKKQFQSHEQQYDKFKSIQRRKRQERKELLHREERSRKKLYSSMDFVKGIDKKSIERDKARQIRVKIKEYQQKVKSQYSPQVDEQKRKQMMNLIEKGVVENSRRVKNVKIENGQLYYQKLNPLDSKEIGKSYFNEVKEMIDKQKKNRKRKRAEDDYVSNVEVKKVDYLEDLKEMRRKNPSMKKDKLAFLDNEKLEFDEKVKQAYMEEGRREKEMKLMEEKLKYGKFKTPQQILNYKWMIDKGYLQIVQMKAKLIE